MSLGIKSIIQGYYSTLRNSTRSITIKSKSQLACLILADLYDQYENTKENNLLNETKFFLEISNPIKHIINILNNSGDNGIMSIDDAILIEYKIIKNINNNNVKVTLLSTIENIILSSIIGGTLTSNKKELFLLEVNKILTNARLFDLIGDDIREFMDNKMYYSLLEEIADRIINNEELKTIIIDILLKIKENKNLITEEIMEKLINKLKLDINKEIETLHGHLDHVGLHTFNQIEEIKKLNSISRKNDIRNSSLFDDNSK